MIECSYLLRKNCKGEFYILKYYTDDYKQFYAVGFENLEDAFYFKLLM
jgi:hypothetical protein